MSTEIVSSFGTTRFSFQGRNARSLIRKIEIFLVLFESLTESGWGSTPSSSSSTALLCLKELYLLLYRSSSTTALWLILQTQSTISTKRSRLSSTSSPSTISASARTEHVQKKRENDSTGRISFSCVVILLSRKINCRLLLRAREYHHHSLLLDIKVHGLELQARCLWLTLLRGVDHRTRQRNVNVRSEIDHEHEANANHQVPVKDEWPSIEKPLPPITASVSVAPPAESEVCGGTADLQSERVDQHLRDRLENIHIAESGPSEDLGVDHVHPGLVGNVQEEDSVVSSESNDNQYTYETQSHPVEHHKDEDEVSSGSADFQELTVERHDQEASHEEDRPAVVIPKHLLIHTEECSQLSFGGFGSRPLSNNAEETPDEAPHKEHSDARNAEFYGDERLGSNTVDGSMGHAPAAGNYDDSLESRREVLKQENPETVQENQYTYAHSEPEYAKQQQLNTAYDASQTNAQNQMQNLASLSNVDARILHLVARAFPCQRRSEAVGSRGRSQCSKTYKVLISPLDQQLPQMHPYSQPTMPLAHFANMISYPLMPQNYPYMPSAFQQTYAGNSSYHQQLAALLPQYKTNLSPSSLPQSATAPASAYGFENSTNVGSAGNFPLSQQSAPTGYEDVLSSQYKESNHLLALQHQQQQNEISAMWHHGHGSRTMSGVPANTYYNLQAQQQQQLQQTQQAAAVGYRQAQQQQQQRYGSYGYSNFYQFQTEMSLERQQQNPRDGAGAQVGQQPSDQTQQLWQNSY
ncbi:hypothetical protein Bca52824_039063 [Brassica carinata]|uniref:Uncharacterized protein n=1 Tax=Brassica carinata TaxID=52824 RepID=A0A8X7UVL3_BRACI|nr:hypothetical protein Bca52824_039063 [Brassica carinata]